ncbi:hypothetical protein [Lapidilactobacillus wuchangensis]|uniref:hypothetical protein n=1 Tax=Lapidilactobacillus wuchangensis TaxID=2486001 RepID=UPI000F7ADEA9|nr:hypothetical protein [Lapidilactobacillus wuchangensis]
MKLSITQMQLIEFVIKHNEIDATPWYSDGKNEFTVNFFRENSDNTLSFFSASNKDHVGSIKTFGTLPILFYSTIEELHDKFELGTNLSPAEALSEFIRVNFINNNVAYGNDPLPISEYESYKPTHLAFSLFNGRKTFILPHFVKEEYEYLGLVQN